MKHVTAIRKIIDDGQIPEAYSAIDNLLSLGPHNLEALKLKALLYHSEGRFMEEAEVWFKVLEVDKEDEDAIGFLIRQQTEDREHYYFTDDLPGGDRRFMAYPRALVSTSAIGLFGCVSFLALSRLADKYPVLGEAKVMLLNFMVLVITPWLGIVYAYMRSIKSVTIGAKGIEISTRLQAIRHPWTDLAKVYLAHTSNPKEPDLALVLVPKDTAARAIFIDLSASSSSLRARSYFLRELAKHSKSLCRKTFEQIADADLRTFRIRKF